MWFWNSDVVSQLAETYGFATLPDSVSAIVQDQFVNDIRCGWGGLVYADPVTGYGPSILEEMLETIGYTYEDVESQLPLSYTSYDAEAAYAQYKKAYYAYAIVRTSYSVPAMGYDDEQENVIIPFAGVGFAIMYNLCGASTDEECNGSSNAEAFNAKLGNLQVNISTAAQLFSGRIGTWAELGRNLQNESQSRILQSIDADITLFLREANNEEQHIFADILREYENLEWFNFSQTNIDVRTSVASVSGIIYR